jgi:hypothetical protein
VRPGSHRFPFTNGGSEVPLELPQGSAVYMSSKLLHLGGANVTTNVVRPVFYASFGDIDIDGPVYSLRKELHGKYTLEQFLPRVFGADELVTLAKGTRLLRSVGGDGPVLIAREEEHALKISEALGVEQLEMLQQLARGPVRVRELPVGSSELLSQLWEGGCIEPTSLAAIMGVY